MRFILSELLMMIVLALVCGAGMILVQAFGHVRPEESFLSAASDKAREWYAGASDFVSGFASDARHEIRRNKDVRKLERNARETLEKLTLRNDQAADDLKKITPASFNESFK